jgi:hypothetical protein
MATFTPPVTYDYSDDVLFGRYGFPVGQSVLLMDGHYSTIPYPWLGEIASLEEGTEWFQGGRTYTVTDEVATALQADGYEVN